MVDGNKLWDSPVQKVSKVLCRSKILYAVFYFCGRHVSVSITLEGISHPCTVAKSSKLSDGWPHYLILAEPANQGWVHCDFYSFLNQLSNTTHNWSAESDFSILFTGIINNCRKWSTFLKRERPSASQRNAESIPFTRWPSIKPVKHPILHR